MATEEINIHKRIIEDQVYYSLSELAHKKSKQKPNEVLRNWINNPDTIDYVENWEQKYNTSYKADSFIRFKLNHYNSKRLIGIHEFIRRVNSKGIISVLDNPTGIFAHLHIAVEFSLWMNPKFKLGLIESINPSHLFELGLA